MRKITSIQQPEDQEEKSFKEEHGYSRVGSIFKRKKPKKINAVSQGEENSAAKSLRVGSQADVEVDQVEFDEHGLPKPGQKYRRGMRPANNPMGK